MYIRGSLGSSDIPCVFYIQSKSSGIWSKSRYVRGRDSGCGMIGWSCSRCRSVDPVRCTGGRGGWTGWGEGWLACGVCGGAARSTTAADADDDDS
jgi:hypothetical protein